MSCRLEALKRHYAPDIEATAGELQEASCGTDEVVPVLKRARTACLDFETITSALNSVKNSQKNSVLQQRASLFDEVKSDLSPEEIQTYLRAETRSLRRRKLIPRRTPTPAVLTSSMVPAEQTGSFACLRKPMQTSNSSDSDGETSVAVGAPVPVDTSTRFVSLESRKEFSLLDVEKIVQRLLAEQKMRLTYEFQMVLQKKLEEQAEAFLRFATDSVHREMATNSDRQHSYLS